jgi:hypothetical protein
MVVAVGGGGGVAFVMRSTATAIEEYRSWRILHYQ